MKVTVLVSVALLSFLGIPNAFAASDPCYAQKDTLRRAEIEFYRQQHKLSSTQERFGRAMERRDSQLLRLTERGADYIHAISRAIADGEERLHYYSHSGRGWGCFNSCSGYRNLKRSIERRIFNAKMRYQRYLTQLPFTIARYQAKVNRVARNVQIAQEDYDRTVAQLEAATTALQACTATIAPQS